MGFGLFAVELLAVFLLVCLLLHRHGNIRTLHPAVTVSVLVTWWFSFVIVFVVPMDVSDTLYDKCTKDRCVNMTESNCTVLCDPPLSYLPQQYLEIFWNVVFWSSQLLTWVILPLLSSYVAAGEFTISGKVKAALIENAVIYGTLGILFGVLLIYVVASKHLDKEAIKVLCITASNTWGLLVLIFLMGYGLVQVPRACWERSSYSELLTQKRFDVSKIKIELEEAQEKLSQILEEVRHINRLVSRSNELRRFVDIIIQKCPSLHNEDLANVNYDDYANGRDDITISRSSLVSVHGKVISAHTNMHRCQVLWDITVSDGLDLEDWVQMKNKEYRAESTLGSIKYHSRVYVIPTLLKSIAVLFALMSLVIIWSEMVFSVKHPTLTICAILVDVVKKPAIVVVVCITFISYMCLCAYYTIFKLRLFNLYYMAPAQQTDDYSLLFSATVLSRLTTPLSLNFLALVHQDTRYNPDIQTAFTTIMGSFEVIPFIAQGFNVYYPILIALIGIATLLKLGTRCMAFLGFQTFVQDDEISMDYVEEGKQLLNRERRSRERGGKNENNAKPSSKRYENKKLLPSRSQSDNTGRFEGDRARLLDSEDYDTNSLLDATPSSSYRHQNTSSSHKNKKSSLFDDV
ncbi:hypothetical protein ACHWQZ_G017060 [Mnemiopsis leidyi]